MNEKFNIQISQHYNIPIDFVDYLCRNTSPFCKCGAFKRLIYSTQSKIGCYLYRCCGKTDCDPNFGKVRPQHSERMRYLVKHGSDEFKNTLMKRDQLFNREVNSIEFKRKRLIKHGYNVSDSSDSDINISYSHLLSNLSKNRDKRKREILQRYAKWEDKYKELILEITDNIIPTQEWLDVISDEDFQYYWSRIHGVNTIRNWDSVRSTRSSFFKQELLSGFKFNTANQVEIFVRSGLEKKYIQFFETHEIPWEYETLILENTDRSGYHIPDFQIEINEKKIILETKGSFYRQPYDEYYNKKIISAIRYAKKHNIRYVLTTQQPDKEMNFLNHALIDTEKI